MNIIDAVVIIIILSFMVFGFKNGFFKQAVVLICTVLSFILAYYFKDYLANILSYTLPFFKFSGDFLGLVSLNILIYQMIAFYIMLSIFLAISGLLIKFAKIFERILKATIILSIPSKILGAVVGLIEGYIVSFILLFLLNQPFINLDIINQSKFKDPIVNSSLVLSNVVGKTNDAVTSIYHLIDNYIEDNDKEKFNREAIDIMLDKKIIKVSYVERLIKLNKLNIPKIDKVINKYR